MTVTTLPDTVSPGAPARLPGRDHEQRPEQHLQLYLVDKVGDSPRSRRLTCTPTGLVQQTGPLVLLVRRAERRRSTVTVLVGLRRPGLRRRRSRSHSRATRRGSTFTDVKGRSHGDLLLAIRSSRHTAAEQQQELRWLLQHEHRSRHREQRPAQRQQQAVDAARRRPARHRRNRLRTARSCRTHARRTSRTGSTAAWSMVRPR